MLSAVIVLIKSVHCRCTKYLYDVNLIKCYDGEYGEVNVIVVEKLGDEEFGLVLVSVTRM